MAAQVNPPTAVDNCSCFDDAEGAGTSTAAPWKKSLQGGRQNTLWACNLLYYESLPHKNTNLGGPLAIISRVSCFGLKSEA